MDVDGLSVTCSGLGFTEEDEDGNRIGYTKGQHCLDNLKDLLRFLRRDDPETREVFKQLCKWKIVAKDLIPIIEQCQDDHDLLLNSVKVLVFLTMPIEFSSKDASQQMEYLWELKSVITCSNTVPLAMSLLEGPLENLQHESFTEDDGKLVQLVLTLFKNVLAIQDISLLQKSGCCATELLSIKDRFLETLFHENVMDIILILTQHVGGPCGHLHQDNFLLLETLNSIFIGQDPATIAQVHHQDNEVAVDAKSSLSSLQSIMEEEEEKKKRIRLQNMSRHSHFGGTFTRFSMDGSKTVFKGNPSVSTRVTLPRPYKYHQSRAKRIVWDREAVSSSQKKILVLLHDFITQLLSGGYNVLMQTIREDIERERYSADNSEISTFLQVAQFVTSFQYHKISTDKPKKEDVFVASNNSVDGTYFGGDICGPVAETMNQSMFSLVFSKWRDTFDGLKHTNNYKMLSVAGSLMKIMIRMLDLVLKLSSDVSKEPQTARVLLYKLFYDQTEEGLTQFVLNQMKSFDSHKQPKSYLADMLEISYLVVRMMEKLQAHGTLRVSRKSRKKAKKVPTGINENTGRSDDCDVSINNKLCKDEDSVDTSVMQEDVDEGSMSKHGDIADNHDSCDDEELTGTTEAEFKVSSLVSAFSNNVIISNLCWLLNFYKDNSSSTNHYIVCMFRRICDELDLSPLFYQLSLLTVFYDILAEQKSNPCEEYEDIVGFLTTLTRRMLRKFKKQPLLFMEILFHKTRRECADINADSVLMEFDGLSKGTKGSADYSNPGETRTTGYTGAPRSRADALGEDEADVVIFHELDNKSEDDVGNELFILRRNARKIKEDISDMNNHILDEETTINTGSEVRHEGRKKRLVLNDELEKKLRGLHDKFKGHKRCSFMIANELDADGSFTSAQVSRKLKQLGLFVPRRGSGANATNADDSKMSDDDVPLSQWKREKIDITSEEHNSDDEVLFSVIKRSRFKKSDNEANLVPQSGNESENPPLPEEISSVEVEGVHADHLDFELEDTDDEISPAVSTEIRSRRRGKMILDLEDE